MIVEGITPLSALVCGGHIGLAASALYAATGRIAGVSGIVGGADFSSPSSGNSILSAHHIISHKSDFSDSIDPLLPLPAPP
jgi:hypothetical protein